MHIETIDPKLASLGIEGTEIQWINGHDSRLSLHGVFYDETEGLYMRMPAEVSTLVSPAVRSLSRMTAGGRLRFVTDSPFIAIKAALPAFKPMPHMSITGSHGFSVYADGIFCARYSPVFDDFLRVSSYSVRERIRFAEKKVIADTVQPRTIEIYFPLYGGVAEICIGVAPGSVIHTAPSYKRTKPMLFYGSSITQGGCVTRPGNDYISILARRLDADYINLGFSGSGNAEDTMIEYIASIDASLYGFDYNMYASRPERILPPHFSIYERIRAKHPDAGILMYDKPSEYWEVRESIIRESYEKAKALGDDLVGFVPAKALLGETEWDCGLVDCSHPNDFGSVRMADALYPGVCKLLGADKA